MPHASGDPVPGESAPPPVRDVDDAFVAHAARAPDAVALIDPDRTLTYAALADETVRVAERLARLGVRPGDRVAVIATKLAETVSVLLGTMRLGALGVPLNPLLKPDQLRHILVDSGARVLVAPRDTLAALERTPERRCPELEHRLATEDEPFATTHRPASGRSDRGNDVHGAGRAHGTNREDGEVEAEAVEAVEASDTNMPVGAGGARAPTDAAAMILYTSGSTAQPKGVVLTRSNLAHGAASVAAYLGIGPDDRLLALMPLSFDYGLNQVLTALTTGARAVLFDYILPKGIATAVVRHRITGLPAVPHLWNQLSRLDWPSVPHLRYVTNTGGRMPVETTRMLERKLPDTRIVLMYGFTEAFRSTWLPPAELARRPDSIGKAVPHATVLVVDENGRECAPGETGELIHGGPLVAAGYWNDEAATRAKFRPRFPSNGGGSSGTAVGSTIASDAGVPAATNTVSANRSRAEERFAWSGDLVRRDEAGFLYFVSRREDLAKLHGYRVNPLEIEAAIGHSPLVHEVSVVCVPHPTLGQGAIAVLVADEGDIAAIERHARDTLPRFMWPERFIVAESLPTNPNGKVDRTALRLRFASSFEMARDPDVPISDA